MATLESGTRPRDGLDRHLADPEARREFRCSRCGYGAIAAAEPLRCPMCGEAHWEERETLGTRWEARERRSLSRTAGTALVRPSTAP